MRDFMLRRASIPPYMLYITIINIVNCECWAAGAFSMVFQSRFSGPILAHNESLADPASPALLKFSRLSAIYGFVEMISVGLVALTAARIYWQQTYNWQPQIWETLIPSVLIALFIWAMNISGERLKLAPLPGPVFLWSAVRTTLRAFSLLIALFFVLKVSDTYSRGVLISQFVAVMGAILTIRASFQAFVRTNLAKGALETDRIIVIGSVASDHSFIQSLTKRGARVVETWALDNESSPAIQKPAEFIKGLVESCRLQVVDIVVVAPSAQSGQLAGQIVDALAETPVTVHVVPPFVEAPVFRHSAEGIGGLPAATVSNRPLAPFELAVKRGFDVIVSLTALIILAPVFLLLAAAIKLDSKGPVFFRQTRHGYGNSAIRVFKFRSMGVLEDGKAFRQATRNDPRITRVGHIIRRTNLDEIPQLFNVLFGEMSIVGPRPHPVALNDSFSDRIKWFNRRHNTRPGITGWAQINGYRGETETIEKMAGRVEHDLWYLDNWSFYLDLKIFLLTVFSPLAYRDAR